MSTDEPTPLDDAADIARRAVALVVADISRTTSWHPDVQVDTWMDGHVVVYVDGGMSGTMSARTELESIAEVADYLQEMLDQNPSIWPVCAAHNAGLHAEVRAGAAVWWCRLGRHLVARIGELDPRDVAP